MLIPSPKSAIHLALSRLGCRPLFLTLEQLRAMNYHKIRLADRIDPSLRESFAKTKLQMPFDELIKKVIESINWQDVQARSLRAAEQVIEDVMDDEQEILQLSDDESPASRKLQLALPMIQEAVNRQQNYAMTEALRRLGAPV